MRVFFLASDWHFLPDGIEDLKKRWSAKLKADNLFAEFEYDPQTYSFWVRCFGDESDPSSEKPERSYELFHKIVLGIVEEESGEDDCGLFDEDEEIESSKLVHITRVKNKHTGAGKSGLPAEEFPQDVRFYSHKNVWKVPDGFDFTEILTKPDFEALKALTGTTLILDSAEQRIFIGGHEEVNVHLAILKLDNISQHKFTRKRLLKATQVFYEEDSEHFEVNLQLFTEIGKKVHQTTIFPPDVYSPEISSAFTIRICPFDPARNFCPAIKPGKLFPLSNQAEVPEKHETWKMFKYAAKNETVDPVTYVVHESAEEPVEPERAGGESEAFRMIEGPTVKEKADDIKKWAADLPAGSDGPSNTTTESKPGQSENDLHQRILQLATNLTKPSSPDPQPESVKAVHSNSQAADESTRHSYSRAMSQSGISNSSSTASSYVTAHQQPMQPSQATAQSCAGFPQSRLTSPVRQAGSQAIQHKASISQSVSPVRNSSPTNKSGNPFGPAHRHPKSTSNLGVQGPPRHPVTTMPVPAKAVCALSKEDKVSPLDSSELRSDNNKPLQMSAPSAAGYKSNDDHGELIQDFSSPRSHAGTLLCEDVPTGLSFAVLQPRKANTLSPTTPKIERLIERIGESGEASSRTFRSTMNQKTPRAKGKKLGKALLPLPMYLGSSPAKKAYGSGDAPKKDPTDGFFKHINDQVEPVFNALRSSRGKVEFKVELGRHLITRVKKPMHGTFDKPNTRKIDDMGKFLSYPESRAGGNAPEMYFTPVLTNLPADVRHLIQLEDKGERIWGKVKDWKVVYTFKCLDPYNEWFYIELDAENFKYEVRSFPESIAVINVHCGKRLWDCRLHAAASNFHPGMKDFAAELAKTLHIPEGLEFPKMSFETSLKHQVHVHEVHVRRICFHENKSTILEVTEIQNLRVEFIDHTERKTRIVRAWSIGDISKELRNKPTWFEVSISSKEMNRALQENEKLDLGEETQWKTEHMMEKCVGSELFAKACNVIKQIDGMGFYNDNGETVREKTTKSTIKRSEPSTGNKFQQPFW